MMRIRGFRWCVCPLILATCAICGATDSFDEQALEDFRADIVQIHEENGRDSVLASEEIAEYGRAAVGPLCEMLDSEPSLDPVYPSTTVYLRATVVRALRRIGDPSAGPALLRKLERTILDPSEFKHWQLIPVCDAIRVLRLREAEYLLEDIMDQGARESPLPPGRDKYGRERLDSGVNSDRKVLYNANSPALASALSAAAALIVVGSPARQEKARQFVMHVAEYGDVGCDSSVSEFMICLALMNTEESLARLGEMIKTCPYLPEEVFLAIPRDSTDEKFTRAYYEFMRDDPAPGMCNGVHYLAALEALAELPLSKDIVPKSFWQQTWNNYKGSLVKRDSISSPPEVITPDMLRPRLRAWMERVGIEDPALDALRNMTDDAEGDITE